MDYDLPFSQKYIRDRQTTDGRRRQLPHRRAIQHRPTCSYSTSKTDSE